METRDPVECRMVDDAFCENTYNYNNVTKVLLAAYMLVGNVMLLNLLIATFT